MRSLRADLSGPVLAIIITVAIIAAGLGVAVYFWYIAPTVAKTPTLVIVGEPAIVGDSLYITVKNIGSKDVTIQSLVLGGQSFSVNEVIQAGTEKALEIGIAGATVPSNAIVAEGVLLTTAGTYPFSAYVVSAPTGYRPMQ